MTRHGSVSWSVPWISGGYIDAGRAERIPKTLLLPFRKARVVAIDGGLVQSLDIEWLAAAGRNGRCELFSFLRTYRCSQW